MLQRDRPTAADLSAWLVRALPFLLVLLADPSSTIGASAAETDTSPVLRIAYFVPNDRQPIPGYAARLDLAVREVQEFCRKGMEHNGHGPMAFTPDRNPDGGLRIHLVHGERPSRDYGRNDSDKVRREVEATMAKAGVVMDQETVLIFEVLLDWRDGKAIEVGPYCGAGDHRTGTAWVFDDERLDPRRLGDRSAGGYYGGPCSIGEFNSHYLGGIAHELGHALGLPHDREATDDLRGTSLMGGGNHTYGQEQRGEGRGTFLSAASALPLARHPLFTGSRKQAAAAPSSALLDLQVDYREKKLRLSGRLTAQPPVYGVVAYNDWARVPDDYDALGQTSPVDKDGAFRLVIGELAPGQWELRLRVCHENGSHSALSFDYEVDQNGTPDLAAFRETWQVGEAVKARAEGDLRRADKLAAEIEAKALAGSAVHRKAAHLRRLCQPLPPSSLATIVESVRQVSVSELEFRDASVGWGRPLRNEVIVESRPTCFLELDGQFHESGLFAHAPAIYTLDLAKGWKRFRSGFGLQDRHDGSVVFIVRGDGKDLFRSPVIKDHQSRQVDVDVSGVGVLELVTEDGNDGANADWGVWLEPRLER